MINPRPSTIGATCTTQYDGDRDLVEKNGSAVVGSYIYGNTLVQKDAEHVIAISFI